MFLAHLIGLEGVKVVTLFLELVLQGKVLMVYTAAVAVAPEQKTQEVRTVRMVVLAS